MGCVHATKTLHREPIDMAREYYNKGKYQRVIDVLKDRITTYIYTMRGDEAEYYLAMSYFRVKDYEDAILEFEFIVNNYPRSKYREEAYYYLALSYYKDSPRIERDQKDLYKALKVISDFKTEYPHSDYTDRMNILESRIKDKLSIKMADVIKTYYNLDKFISARLYIHLLRKEYPNTTGENLSYIFEALIKKNEGDEYNDILSRIDTTKIPKKFKKYYKTLIRQD